MSGFLRALHKVGLIQLDDDHLESPKHEAPAAEADAQGTPQAYEAYAQAQGTHQPSSQPAMPVPLDAYYQPDASGGAAASTVAAQHGGETGGGSFEMQSFEEIYRAYNVPPSAFAAEKLLKVLDGLMALDPLTRKAAVLALDAADDNWTIDDAVRDAGTKMQALQNASSQLMAGVAQALDTAHQAVVAREESLRGTVEQITQQINELQALMAREVQRAATDKAEAEYLAQSARETAERDAARIHSEIARLQEIQRIFGTPAT